MNFNKRILSRGCLVITAFLLGLTIRLSLAYFFPGNFDQESYEIVARIMHQGKSVYAETSRYNYTPLWSHFLSAFYSIAKATSLPIHFVVRAFLSLVDLFNALLIGLIGKRNDSDSFIYAFSAYWLNPVAILIVGYHGQFDTFAMLPLLLAVYLSEGRNHKLPFAWIWLLGTFSIIIKHITVFGVLALFFHVAKNKIQACIFSIGSVVAFLLTFAPHILVNADGVLNNVFYYQGHIGIYGLSSLISPSFAFILFYCIMGFIVVFNKELLKSPLPKSINFIFVSFLTFTHGIGEQYFLLPVLWGSIYRSKWFWIFSIAAGLFLLGSGNNLNLPGIPAWWNGVWLAAAGWFLSFFFPAIAHRMKTVTPMR